MMKLECSSINFRRLYLFFPNIRRFSTPSTEKGNPSSSSTYTSTSTSTSLANYLVNSLGLSNQHSLSISAKLTKWRGPERSNWVSNFESVVQFLYQLGFQQSDFREIIFRKPQIFIIRVQTLKPRIKILNDLGISGSDLVQLIVSHPFILHQRLDSVIHALKNVLGSDEIVVTALKRSKGFNVDGYCNYLIPNVKLLQSYCAISDDKIQKFILQRPRVFVSRTDLFRDCLIRVEEKLGIPPDSGMFVYGLLLLASFTHKKLESKFQVFKSFGWEEDDVKALIKRHPVCMTSSEANIKNKLDFLMNQLGYKPNYLASLPVLFICSVEKTLLPRHRVLEVLKDKGLLQKDYLLGTAASLSKPMFLKRFVLPFEEVHEVYAKLTGSAVGSLTVSSANGQIKS